MLLRRTYSYVNTNQFKQAIKDYTILIEAYPSFGAYYQGRAFIYLKLENNEKALQDFIKANQLGINIDPKIINTLQNMNK
jgi:tetratricopeptide (TPR) repeat protein